MRLPRNKMAPAELAVSCKYSCCVCENSFQTVSSLHNHYTYVHSTEELSKALLSVKGLELPVEEKTPNKLVTELCPVINGLTKCKEFVSSRPGKGIESDGESTATAESASSGRAINVTVTSNISGVKILDTNTDSNNFQSKTPLTNKVDSNKVLDDIDSDELKPDLQLESLGGQELMDYCENTPDGTIEIDFDEDPYAIDFEELSEKDNGTKKISSLWHMSGDEKECVMGIMKLRSPDLKSPIYATKSKMVNTPNKIINSKPNNPCSVSNEVEVAKNVSQSSDRKLSALSVYDFSSPSEHSTPLKNFVRSKFSGTFLEKLKNFKPQGKSGRHVKRKMSRTPKRLILGKHQQEVPTTNTNLKSELNGELTMIPMNLSVESSSNATNSTSNTLQIEPLKYYNSLSDLLSVSQRNVSDKLKAKTLKDNRRVQKLVSFRRKKDTEVKIESKVTSEMSDEKSILASRLSGLNDNLLSKLNLPNPSDVSFLMKIYPPGMTDRRFFCEPCGKGYTKKSHLERHLRVHTGERPFPCLHCDKRFAVRSILKQHVRIHTGEKPYSCNVCQTRFPQKSGLMTHMMLHTGKPFKCDSCHKAFVSNHKLLQHLRCHNSKTTTHVCKVCKMCFYTEGALLEHSRVHKEVHQYSCMACKESFVLEIHLKQHLDRHLQCVN